MAEDPRPEWTAHLGHIDIDEVCIQSPGGDFGVTADIGALCTVVSSGACKLNSRVARRAPSSLEEGLGSSKAFEGPLGGPGFLIGPSCTINSSSPGSPQASGHSYPCEPFAHGPEGGQIAMVGNYRGPRLTAEV